MHAYVCAWVLLISLVVPSPSDEEVPVHKAVVEMNDQMKQVDSLVPRFERDPGNEANHIVWNNNNIIYDFDRQFGAI